MSDLEGLADLARTLASTRENLLEAYRPHPKQYEFHRLGVMFRERALMAGNQLGKTLAISAETAFHLTGNYPEWWEGKRFSGPIRCWVGGPTAEHCRDNPQRLLLGPDSDNPGEGGMIPKEGIIKITRANRPPGLVDHFFVHHRQGGQSYCAFKSADIENPQAGRKRWQGDTVDLIWLDEEPPPLIYTEALARTSASNGIVMLSFTPLLGMTEIARWFYPQGNTPDRTTVMMTIEDALHYTKEQRERVIASYPPHEREARTRGIPMLGSGRIFPVADETIVVSPFEVPSHWKHLIGMDFGWGDHPTAAVDMAIDESADCLYVVKEYRQSEPSVVLHARAMKAWGEFPVSWPHDGMQSDRTGGGRSADLYKAEGLRMFPTHATFPPTPENPKGSLSVQDGLKEMLDRMRTGRWKIFATCPLWLEEFRLYHHFRGKIVKKQDDLISASRYAMMMKRIARTLPEAYAAKRMRDTAKTGPWNPLDFSSGFSVHRDG